MHETGMSSSCDELSRPGFAEGRERPLAEALQAAEARLIQSQALLRAVTTEARRWQLITADHATRQDMARQLTEKEAVLQDMTRQLLEKEAALHDMARQLIEKDAALRDMTRQLVEKEAALQDMARQLTEKESVIAQLHVAAEQRLQLLEEYARGRDPT